MWENFSLSIQVAKNARRLIIFQGEISNFTLK